jgi:hypothetical protein
MQQNNTTQDDLEAILNENGQRLAEQPRVKEVQPLVRCHFRQVSIFKGSSAENEGEMLAGAQHTTAANESHLCRGENEALS